MAVKAIQTITLYHVIDIVSSQNYYILATSTPNPPSGASPTGWSTTEPAYTAGSTKDLYVATQTVWSNGDITYSAVTKSSSYEAAKQAYNAASAASSAAAAAKTVIVSSTEPGSTDRDKIWFDITEQKFKEWNTREEVWEVVHDNTQDILDAVDENYQDAVQYATDETIALNNLMKAYNSTMFGKNVIVSDTTPVDPDPIPQEGYEPVHSKFWFDTTVQKMKKWNEEESSWIEILPSSILYTLEEASTKIEKFDGEVRMTFNTTEEKDVFTDNWENTLSTLRQYGRRFIFNSFGLTISCDPPEGSPPDAESDYKLFLTNTGVSILQKSTPISTWDATTGFTCPTVTTTSLVLKQNEASNHVFKFVYNANGSVSFRKE